MKKLLLVLFTSIAIFTTIPFGLTSCTKTVVNYDTTVIVHNDTSTIIHNDTTLIRDTIVGIDTNITSSPYYVKATVNGSNVSFTNYTAAVDNYGGSVTILGHNNTDYDNSDGVTLELFYSTSSSSPSNTLPIAGTYNLTSSWTPFQVFQAFVTDSGRFYDAITSSPTLDFHCTITTINSTYVSGTFYGTVYSEHTPETITNGSFYVPF
jgi:hypothetical protein